MRRLGVDVLRYERPVQHDRLTALRCAAQEITPVFSACPNLATLRLQGCGQLRPTALQPLCQRGNASLPALPRLSTLDVSYCPVPCAELAALLLHATQLQVGGLPGVCLSSN